MSTREEAILALSKRLNQDASEESAKAEFCDQFTIRPFKDGWCFEAKQPQGRGISAPLWWMVVGSGVYGFYFFKVAKPRAYAAALALHEASVRG